MAYFLTLGGEVQELQGWDMPMAPISDCASAGHTVRHLQHRLQQMGLYKGDLDGELGPMTQSALRDFQTMAGPTMGAGEGSVQEVSRPVRSATGTAE